MALKYTRHGRCRWCQQAQPIGTARVVPRRFPGGDPASGTMIDGNIEAGEETSTDIMGRRKLRQSLSAWPWGSQYQMMHTRNTHYCSRAYLTLTAEVTCSLIMDISSHRVLLYYPTAFRPEIACQPASFLSGGCRPRGAYEEDVELRPGQGMAAVTNWGSPVSLCPD